MRKIQYPPVYAGTFFLLVTAVLSVITDQAGLPELLLNFSFYPVLIGIGLASGAVYRKKRNNLSKTVSLLVIIAAFPVLLAMYYFHGMEKAAVVFLIWLQAGRNFTLSTRRDLFYAYIVSLILILYGASVSKETSFLVYILTYVLAGIFTLMSDHIDERLSAAKGGDKDFLKEGMKLPSTGIGLSIATLALSSLIYLLFPRLPPPHLEGLPFGSGSFYENEKWENETQRSRPSEKGPISPDTGVNGEPYSQIPKRIKLQQLSESGTSADETEYPGFRSSFDALDCKKKRFREPYSFTSSPNAPSMSEARSSTISTERCGMKPRTKEIWLGRSGRAFFLIEITEVREQGRYI